MSRSSGAFFSGSYRTWKVTTVVGAGRRGFQRARIKGLRDAVADRFFGEATVLVNNVKYPLKNDGDRLIFEDRFPKGTYRIEIFITYTNLEKTVYW